MERIRFRVVLPVAVLVLTVVLLVWAHIEELEFWSPSSSVPWTGEVVTAWDYMPAGRRLALNLNFPIALVYQPLHSYLRDHTQMGPPPWEYDIPFLIAVPILWYWPGRGLDRYRGLLLYNTRSPRGLILTAVLWLGLLACLLIPAITTLAFLRGYTAVFGGSVLWSAGLLIYIVRQLLRRPFRLRPSGVG